MKYNRYFDVNDSHQWVQFNRHEEDHPLLLIVDGGFYQPELHRLIHTQVNDMTSLTVVMWDQRGLGNSKSAVDDWKEINIEDYTSDLVSLVQRLLEYFHKDKLFLLSHCFGSIPALLAVHQNPEYFHAYFSVSQVVHPLKNILASYEKIFNLSAGQGNFRPVHELQELEILSGTSKSARKIRQNAHLAYKLDPASQSVIVPVILGKLLQIMTNPFQIWNHRSGSHNRRMYLHSEIMQVDFPETIQEVTVPIHFLVGRQDKLAPPKLAEDYFHKLKAPHKTFIWFEKSGHFPFLQEPDKFKDVLRKEMALAQDTAVKKTPSVWNMVMSLC